MDKNLLGNLAKEYNVPMGTIEKDYVLTRLLCMIADYPKLNKMVFKGGTAIKKIYFDDFRFSEDLDFTCIDDVSDDFINFIQQNLHTSDVKFTEISDVQKTDHSCKFKIKFDQMDGFKTSIKIDLSLRKDIVKKPSTRPILHFYGMSYSGVSFRTISLEEIMAEKIRAVTYAKHPRHLYDIHYLYNHGVKINFDLVESKIKSAYGDKFDINLLKDRLPEKQRNWHNHLNNLLSGRPPEFEKISKEVLDVITKEMKSSNART